MVSKETKLCSQHTLRFEYYKLICAAAPVTESNHECFFVYAWPGLHVNKGNYQTLGTSVNHRYVHVIRSKEKVVLLL